MQWFLIRFMDYGRVVHAMDRNINLIEKAAVITIGNDRGKRKNRNIIPSLNSVCNLWVGVEGGNLIFPLCTAREQSTTWTEI
jgi:hypothetical protein